MPKKRIVCSLFVVLALTLGSAQLAQAEDTQSLSEPHLEKIRSLCVETQSSLRQTRSSDTLLRVNQGQRYEQMATKLMAPMNSRIALNRFDGNDLLSTTATYEQTLGDFRDQFRFYDDAVSAAIDEDCRENPQQFYDQVTEARDKRRTLHKTTEELNSLLKKYRTQFGEFADSLEQQRQERS